MNPKQEQEVEILTRLEAGALDPSSAAMLLGVSPRQVRRLRARFRQQRFEAVIHGNTGRDPANRTDPATLPAYSPQAKGRIERFWTRRGFVDAGWGTWQDRLTKELRLAGITSLEEANAFLPGFLRRYNARFARAPQDPDSAWVQLPGQFDLAYCFAVRQTRKVGSDHCISFSGPLLQLLPDPKGASLVDKSVTVHIVPEGDIYLHHGKPPIPSAQAVPTKHLARQPKPMDPKAAARRRCGPAPVGSKGDRWCTLATPHASKTPGVRGSAPDSKRTFSLSN